MSQQHRCSGRDIINSPGINYFSEMLQSSESSPFSPSSVCDMPLGLTECKSFKVLTNVFAVFAHLTRSSVRNGNSKRDAFRLSPIGLKITSDAVAAKATSMYVATISRRDTPTSRLSYVATIRCLLLHRLLDVDRRNVRVSRREIVATYYTYGDHQTPMP